MTTTRSDLLKAREAHPDEGYDPKERAQCPEDGGWWGVRHGRLNRHMVGKVRGQPVVESDGVQSSPLGPDGFCIASGRKVR